MPILKRLAAAAAIAVLVSVQAATAQTVTQPAAPASESPVSQTQPTPAARQPLPYFLADLGGTSIKVPYFTNHCGLDLTQDVDRQMLEVGGKGLGADQTMISVTTPCTALTKARTEGIDKLQSIILYAAIDQPASEALKPAEVARLLCDNIPTSVTLTKTTAEERAQELSAVAQTSGKQETGRLALTPRACYFGLTQHEAGGDASTVIATFALNGKLILIAPVSLKGPKLTLLLKQAGRLVTEITTINSGQ